MKRLIVLLFLLVLIPLPAQSVDCSLLVGMSQIKQVYEGRSQDPPMPGWMLIWKSGARLGAWNEYSDWNNVTEVNRCAPDNQIVRVAFGFDPLGSNWPTDLHRAVGIMETRYPNASISVFLLVGGEGHVICFRNGEPVRASTTHRDFIGLMPDAAQGTVATLGPDIDVPCDQYSDNVGHLKEVGRYNARQQFTAFYEA